MQQKAMLNVRIDHSCVYLFLNNIKSKKKVGNPIEIKNLLRGFTEGNPRKETQNLLRFWGLSKMYVSKLIPFYGEGGGVTPCQQAFTRCTIFLARSAVMVIWTVRARIIGRQYASMHVSLLYFCASIHVYLYFTSVPVCMYIFIMLLCQYACITLFYFCASMHVSLLYFCASMHV